MTCQNKIDYKCVVEHINDGVVIIRNGIIAFANHAFCEISQRDLGRVVGLHFSEFISLPDCKTVMDYCENRLLGKSLADRIEFSMPRADGEAIIEMKVSLIDCGGVPALLCALTDITERRKTRHELQRIKERFESILASMNDVVVSLSPVDGSIVAINPAAEVLYGVPLRDFTSGAKHVLDFIHAMDEGSVKRFYRNLPEVEFDEMRYRIVTGSKRIKWVHDEGYVIYSAEGTIRRIDHVIKDITDEKQALDALRQSEAKYRDFFESTSDMAYQVTPDGVFMDINDAGLKLLGLESLEEARKCNVKEFYVDLSERAGLLAEIREKGYAEDRQIRLKNKAGEVFEVAITARAKTDEDGEILYYDGIGHNITKALEDQRNRVLRNAAGALCHYLNTHLMQLEASTGVLSKEMQSLKLLIKRLAEGENPQELAEKLSSTVETMHYFHEAVCDAYARIAEVTTAFNKAFLYREDTYANATILDIFKAYGYEAESS